MFMTLVCLYTESLVLPGVLTTKCCKSAPGCWSAQVKSASLIQYKQYSIAYTV